MKNIIMSLLLIISIACNCVVIIGGGIFIYNKGGITYLKTKLSPPQSKKQFHSNIYPGLLSRLDILPKTKGDIIFIGDSHTEGLDWAKMFSENRIRNMGIGMETSEGILKRLDTVIRLQPTKLFIMVGIADLNNYYVPLPKIIDNFRKIIQEIEKESPQTKLFVQSVLPKKKYASTYIGLNRDILILNEELNALCSKYDQATYIDLHKLFSTTGNELSTQYTYDGGHLNGQGYLLWVSVIKEFVEF